MAVKTFAAIDVGSYELAMKIFEFSQKGGMKVIDHIRHGIELGTDTYLTGKISGELVDELCEVLTDFKNIMDTYKVDAYKAYGTSAIRETVNSVIVLEQIKLRTGINVEVLSNSEQRFLHYKAAALKGVQFENIISKGAAIVDIGGGSIQVSLFSDSSLVTTQNIRLGILRVRDMLTNLAPQTNNYESLLEEVLDNQLLVFKRHYLEDCHIENLILIDDYISYAMKRIGNDRDMVTVEEFDGLMERVHSANPERIAKGLGIAEEAASLLLPSLYLVKRVLKITKAKVIWAPGVSLGDGMAYEYAENKKLVHAIHDFENDILKCAEAMSDRYMGNKERNQLVESIAVRLFESTKKIHGMGKRELLLLRIASKLSDCGRYVSLEAAAECGYSIIMATEMIGLSHMEREIVANIVRFNKTKFMYFKDMNQDSVIDKNTYLTIAKLTALFRVADGICRSDGKKVKAIDAAIKDDELIIRVDTDADIILEKGFFGRKTELFEEVFSIKPVLKQKMKYKTL